MSLTTTTTTSTNAKTVTVPEVNTTQLQALADVCCSSVNASSVNPIMNSVMNSLVSPTKVVTNDDIVNPIPTCVASNIELPKKIPISIVSVPIMHTKTTSDVDSEDSEIPFTSVSLTAKRSELVKSHDVPDEEDMKDEEFIEPTAHTVTTTPAPVGMDNSTGATTSATARTSVAPNDANQINKLVEEDISIDEANQTTPMGVNTANSNILASAAAALSPETTNTIAMNAVLEENNLSPLSPSTINEPMECSSSLTSQISPREEELTTSKLLATGHSEDVIMTETPFPDDTNVSNVSSMQAFPG